MTTPNLPEFPFSTPIDKGSADYYSLPYEIINGISYITFESQKHLIETIHNLDIWFSYSLCGSGSMACYLSDIFPQISKQLEEHLRNEEYYSFLSKQ